MRQIFFALVALAVVQVSASADSVDFTFTLVCPTCFYPGGSPAELITTPLGGGDYLVTSLSGTVGGFPASLAPAGTVHGSGTSTTTSYITIFHADLIFRLQRLGHLNRWEYL